MEPTIQTAMSEMLAALGFERMAAEVKTESELDRLRMYARVIVKNSPEHLKARAANLFRLHKPALY